ncbi:MAG TPA: hypothetical protein EYQ76_01190 [Candidatus Marinimicrobia bacterium]|nr:hypothetical protein [Candidatus Neomarinimicrobiota bacterium]HIL86491.1 hypothetical protein [Candidatus Neomarinimicrobiota bacterium]
MKKILIITLSFMIYSCAIPISIGNRVVETPSATNEAETSVYASQSATMMAINHILPAKSAAFEMMNKTIILPAFKRNDINVYNSLQFLAPEGQNEDGTYTFVYVASPYLEDKNYDILDVLIAEYGRSRAEEYFDIWLSCFAYEQEVMSFR